MSATAESEATTQAASPGALIREARENKGLTQDQLAEALHKNGYRRQVHHSTMSQIENGYYEVPVLMRPHLEKVLGITLPRRNHYSGRGTRSGR